MEPKPVNPYTFVGQVFAVGARVYEIPLIRPDPNDATKFKLTKKPVTKKRKRMYRLIPGFGVEGFAPLCMDANDGETLFDGFLTRLLRDVPEPNILKLERLKRFCIRQVATLPVVRPYELEEWLATTSYSLQRKEQLRVAFLSLGGRPPAERDLHKVKTFMKTEFYAQNKHARMINPREDAVMVFLALRFKAIEKVVYQTPEEGAPADRCTIWSRHGHSESFFIKHVPIKDRNKKLAYLNVLGYRLFASDFTAYESHFTPAILDACEFNLYKHCLQTDPGLGHVLRAIGGKNRLKSRLGVSAIVQGRRMSGDANTSLGNGFTNMLLLKFIAEENGFDAFGYVEGDDGLFAVNGGLVKEDYLELGFTIKIEEPNDPLTAGFCGLIYSATGETIRDPYKFLQGFGWTHQCITAGRKTIFALLRGKALSCNSETPQCPIVGELYRVALRATRGLKARFTQDGYHTCPKDEALVDPFNPATDTRLLFEKAYGVSVQDQLRAEACIRSGEFALLQGILVPKSDVLRYSLTYVEVS